VIVRPRRGLAGRLAPYTAAARASLGSPVAQVGERPIREVLLRPLGDLIRRVARRLGASDDELELRLGQAGFATDVPPEDRVAEYRLRVVGRTVAGVAAGGAAGTVLPIATS